MSLTGRFRFRTTRWRQKQILQVEENWRQHLGFGDTVPGARWRDATPAESSMFLVSEIRAKPVVFRSACPPGFDKALEAADKTLRQVIAEIIAEQRLKEAA